MSAGDTVLHEYCTQLVYFNDFVVHFAAIQPD